MARRRGPAHRGQVLEVDAAGGRDGFQLAVVGQLLRGPVAVEERVARRIAAAPAGVEVELLDHRRKRGQAASARHHQHVGESLRAPGEREIPRDAVEVDHLVVPSRLDAEERLRQPARPALVVHLPHHVELEEPVLSRLVGRGGDGVGVAHRPAPLDAGRVEVGSVAHSALGVGHAPGERAVLAAQGDVLPGLVLGKAAAGGRLQAENPQDRRQGLPGDGEAGLSLRHGSRCADSLRQTSGARPRRAPGRRI